MPSRYAEQLGRYAEQLEPELLRIATRLVAMRSSQGVFRSPISRYAYTYLDIYQAAAHLLLLRPCSRASKRALDGERPIDAHKATRPTDDRIPVTGEDELSIAGKLLGPALSPGPISARIPRTLGAGEPGTVKARMCDAPGLCRRFPPTILDGWPSKSPSADGSLQHVARRHAPSRGITHHSVSAQ